MGQTHSSGSLRIVQVRTPYALPVAFSVGLAFVIGVTVSIAAVRMVHEFRHRIDRVIEVPGLFVRLVVRILGKLVRFDFSWAERV